MYKMKKYIFFLPFLFSLILLSSCSEPDRTTIDGDIPYFEAKSIDVEVSADNNGKFSVDVYRINPIGSTDVDLNLTLPEGISADMFELVSNKVSFKDGEYKSSVEIKFDLSKLVVPVVYSLKLAIGESPRFGFVEPLTISVNKEWVFNQELGKGKFTSEAFDLKDKEVDVLGINGNDGVYSIKDAYAEGFPINFALVDGGKDIVFKDQKIGRNHTTYGAYYVSLVDFEVEGKTINLLLELYVAAGSFGTYVETIELP